MKKKKILLVEDDSDHADLIIDVLNSTDINAQIILMRDGQEFIDYFRQTETGSDDETRFEVIMVILDLNLPKVHGMDVLKFLKKNPIYSSIPVIILSTSDNPKTISEAYKNGADIFITKRAFCKEFIEEVSFTPFVQFMPGCSDKSSGRAGKL